MESSALKGSSGETSAPSFFLRDELAASRAALACYNGRARLPESMPIRKARSRR